jgi:hypothetical protein
MRCALILVPKLRLGTLNYLQSSVMKSSLPVAQAFQPVPVCSALTSGGRDARRYELFIIYG